MKSASDRGARPLDAATGPARGRLRICLVSEEYPPESGWGGIATYTHVLALGLAGLGHRVHVVARGWETRTDEGPVTVHRLRIGEPSWRRGRRWVPLRFPETRGVLLWSWAVRQAIRRIEASEGLDVVEAPEYHAQTLLADTSRRVPLVVRLHLPTFLGRRVSGRSVAGSRLDRALTERWERRVAGKAAMITSPSRHLARAVSSAWGVDARSIRVLPNPIDDGSFAPGAAPAEGPSILFVGRVSRIKGAETLIHAVPSILRDHPAATVSLIGKDHPSGPDGSMTRHLRGVLGRAGVSEDRVTFLGYHERAALPDRYRAAAVCVVPSLYESFSYGCLEAMASGRPVIASAVGGIPEIVTDGEDGLLVPPGDAGALARAVSRVLGDPALARRLGERARRTAVERFGFHRLSAETADLYGSLVGGRRG